jgi:hypothetical protein
LGVLKSILENDEYKRDDAFAATSRKHEKIMAAIKRATANLPTINKQTFPLVIVELLARTQKLK